MNLDFLSQVSCCHAAGDSHYTLERLKNRQDEHEADPPRQHQSDDYRSDENGTDCLVPALFVVIFSFRFIDLEQKPLQPTDNPFGSGL